MNSETAHTSSTSASVSTSLQRLLVSINWHYVIIITIGVITHGLVLLMDGIYWDSWLTYSYYQAPDGWQPLRSLSSETGAPVYITFMNWFLGQSPDYVTGFRVVVVVSTLITGILIYQIGNETGFVSRLESLFIALLSISYPAFQVLFLTTNWGAPRGYLFFLLGWLLALRAEKKHGIQHVALRVGALACFILLGFLYKATLVYHFGFLVLFLLYAKHLKGLSFKQLLTHFLPRRLDYVLLPFVYWFATEALFPVHGGYENYNRPSFSMVSIIGAYILTLWAQFYHVNNALVLLIMQPLLGLLLGIAAYWFYNWRKLGTTRFSGQSHALFLAAFGIVLFGLGVFPFAAVGKIPYAFYGVGTRYALLLGLPIGIILVVTLRAVFVNNAGTLSRTGFCLLVILVALFSAVHVTNYVHWQARWIKDRAIIHHLEQRDPGNISVFWIDDQHSAGQEAGFDVYSFYVWSSLFKHIWDGESRIGLDQRRESYSDLLTTGTPYFTSRYNLSDFDPAGCQAILTIRDGLENDDFTLVARYYFRKFVRGDTSLKQFLSDVVVIDIEPIDAPEAVHCSH